MKIGTCKFRKWNCDVIKSQYGNGRPALELIDTKTKEPIATASVNLPDEEMEENNEVFIKDYSENQGMADALIVAEIIKGPIGVARSGFVTIFKYIINE